ncbi:DNA mismatch repair protein, partial [Phytophthora pseudosyringae]
MALSVLDGKTRDLMSASYALPDLETAVKQVMFNSIDAHAKTIKLSVDVAAASFTAVDD